MKGAMSLRDYRLKRAAARTVDSTQGTQLSRVQEVFAIVGITAGFLFLLTIPGWYGIRAWRRYRQGEPSSIRSYFYFGVIVSAFIVLVVVIAAVSAAVGTEF
jgi:hypothetical protein